MSNQSKKGVDGLAVGIVVFAVVFAVGAIVLAAIEGGVRP